MKHQQEKKVNQFELVQYNVNFMVVEIIDVTSEILQTIPQQNVAGIMYMSYIYSIYTYSVYIYIVYICVCFYIYTSETLAGPSCQPALVGVSFCDQRDAMSLFSRKKPKFRHLGRETSWSWHGVGNHAAPKITGKSWDRLLLVHAQSYMCMYIIYIVHNMFFLAGESCRYGEQNKRFEALPSQRRKVSAELKQNQFPPSEFNLYKNLWKKLKGQNSSNDKCIYCK